MSLPERRLDAARRPARRRRAPTRSSTCTCTPSTPCSTAPRGSATCSPGRPRWGCRPSPRPTTATSSAPTSSGRRPRAPASSRSSASRPTSPRAPTAPTRPGSSGATSAAAPATTSPARGAYTHMTLLARDNTGLHNLFRMDSQASLDQVYAKWPRVDRELLDRYGKGLIATSGCASGEIQTRLRLGQYDEAKQAASELPGHLRQGELLLRGHGPRPRRRAPVHEGPHPAGARARHAVRRHQRPALHQPRGRQGALGAAVRAVRLDDDGPQPVQVRRRRLLPQEPGRDAPHLARAARGLRQHPAHRRDVRDLVHRGRGALHAPLPLPARARTRRAGSSRRSQRGLRERFPGGIPDYAQKQAEFETEVIVTKGYAGYFLVVADFITWAKEQRHPGRPGPWLGRRLDVRLRDEDHRPRPHPARPDLRAVPQPRAPLAARLRRRLRRAPARRGDPLRHREVRQRAGRADRHLRHDQGQAGRQGRRPGDGPPVRGG